MLGMTLFTAFIWMMLIILPVVEGSGWLDRHRPRATYNSIASDDSPASYNISTSFPQIWVTAGLIICDGPLEPDSCSIIETTDIVTSSTTSGQSIVLFTTDIVTIVGTSISSYGYTSAVLSLTSFPNATTITSPSATTTSQGSATLAARQFYTHPHGRQGKSLFPRDYDYSACEGQPPKHDFVSDSLSGVCHFVANIQDRFVSLTPTAAAFQPSWMEYVAALLITAVQSLLGLRKKNYQKHTMIELLVNMVMIVAGLVWAFMRFINAMLTVSSPPYHTIPFVSPLLWVDWIIVAEFLFTMSTEEGQMTYQQAYPNGIPEDEVCGEVCGQIGLKAIRISGCLAIIVVWAVCLWLCVGYHVGYGTEQYLVLDIPAQCQNDGIQWETDPRRVYFLWFHMIIFICGSIGGILGLCRIDWTGASEPVLGYHRSKIFGKLSKSVALCALLPEFVALVITIILNRSDYLILGQQGCYASYVSSRLGYLDADIIGYSPRLAIFLGLIV